MLACMIPSRVTQPGERHSGPGCRFGRGRGVWFNRAHSRATAPETELLLRSRRLQEESDPAVSTLPRPKGLSRRHHHRHQRHATRADTTPSPRALQTFRRRPSDHRSLAGKPLRIGKTTNLALCPSLRNAHRGRAPGPALTKPLLQQGLSACSSRSNHNCDVS